MEHVPLDLLTFRRIAEVAKARTTPTLQLHLLPSALMFRQYGPHGYRGYSSQILKTIADLFTDFSEVSIYTLGGPRCVEVHCDYILTASTPQSRTAANHGDGDLTMSPQRKLRSVPTWPRRAFQ